MQESVKEPAKTATPRKAPKSNIRMPLSMERERKLERDINVLKNIFYDTIERPKLLIKTKNLEPEDKIFAHEVQTYSNNIKDLAIKIGIAEKKV